MKLSTVSVVAKRIKEYVLEKRVAQVTFFWQGGEIMEMGVAWVREAHAILEERLAGCGAELVHRLQTNLLMVDSEWISAIKELFDGRISSSFDYPNLYRREVAQDPGAYTATWLEKFALVREAGCRCGVICIPSAETVRLGPEELCSFFFETAKADGFQLNLPFPTPAWNGRSGPDFEQPSVAALSRFCRELHDHWVEVYLPQGKQVQPIARLRAYFTGGDRRLPCIWGKDCTAGFVCIGPDGEVGLCDCWVLSYPEYNGGNLLVDSLDDIMRSPSRIRIRDRLESLASGTCGECSELENCYGGCPIRAFALTGDPVVRDPYCALYRDLFGHLQTSFSNGVKREVIG